MNRNDVTEKIISTKVAKGLQWEAIAKKVGQSKEWTTALCLGQMTATAEQAKILGRRTAWAMHRQLTGGDVPELDAFVGR